MRADYITKGISGFLLLVFALSITPKGLLHTIFADHTDKKFEKNSSGTTQFIYSGYNCDTDNIVAESNFVSDQQIFSFPVFASFSPGIFKNISFSSSLAVYSSLRGPPVI